MQIQYIYIYIYILLSLNFNFNYCINNFLYKSINHVLNNKFKYISITALAFIFLNYKKTIFKYFDKNSYYKKEPKNSSLFSNKEDLNLKKQNPNYTSKEELYGKQQEKSQSQQNKESQQEAYNLSFVNKEPENSSLFLNKEQEKQDSNYTSKKKLYEKQQNEESQQEANPKDYNLFFVNSENFKFEEISNRAKNFLVLFNNELEEQNLDKNKKNNAMNGALTFCLPVIFIDFFLFKNIKVTNKKYDIFEHSYAYSNYLEDKDRTIVIKNFLIQNNININQELINILNSIHFQYAKEEYSSIQQNIDDYFRDNIFYSTYNFLVELFFKSKDKNILNLFFINAFDSDHCYPYQKRNLTDFLFLLEEKALSFTDCFKDDKKIDETVLSKFVFYKNFYENTKTDKEILNIIVADFNKETLNAIKNDYIHLGYNGTYVNTNGYFSIKNKHNDNLSGNLNNSNLELYNFFNKVLINSEILESEEVINKKQAESDFLKNLCQEFYKKNKDLNLKELLTNFKNTKDYKDNFYKKIPDVTILGFFRQFNKSQQIKN